MFQSKKIAAAAGVLGSFALIGVGAVQAVGAEGRPGNCTEDEKGNVRCVQVSEHRITRGEDGKVRIDGKSSQTCSGSGAELSCVSSVVFDGKKP
ncbi:hypothetical protein [Streptomyces sp. Tu 3180]|uniref:hypothetical protein n=1 Tax=Streptomyces sp. Tu 3180 TaxID=2682611 RepID=UPI00135A233C|nr:hypothetical protein [Streptomyces sp. Tu 3180]KAF3465478.1 hypothetical protein GL259_14800 [Streptomyces sp. Tu 3180]